MEELKKYLWSVLSENSDLTGLLSKGEESIFYEHSPVKQLRPCLTFVLTSCAKVAPTVAEIKRCTFSFVVWAETDVLAQQISEIVANLLDVSRLRTIDEIQIDDSDVGVMVGPYWDRDNQCFRTDITVTVIVRIK